MLRNFLFCWLLLAGVHLMAQPGNQVLLQELTPVIAATDQYDARKNQSIDSIRRSIHPHSLKDQFEGYMPTTRD